MSDTEHQAQTAREAFAPLSASGVALLTSFRRNGQGVGTPVSIELANGKAYFTTRAKTWKVKRIANNPRVTLAPCTRRGKAIGPTVEGIAHRLEGAEAEQARVMLSDGLWGKLWDLTYRFVYRDRSVLYEVSPPIEGQATQDRDDPRPSESNTNSER